MSHGDDDDGPSGKGESKLKAAAAESTNSQPESDDEQESNGKHSGADEKENTKAQRPTLFSQGTLGSEGLENEADSVKEKPNTCGRFLTERILTHPLTEVFMGIVIVVNFITIVMDIDARAGGQEIPEWRVNIEFIFMTIYTIEFAARLNVERREIFDSPWNIMDFAVLFFSAIDMAVTVVGFDIEELSLFRILRMMRVMRILRLLSKLRELRKLMQMMACCMKTLAWSFLFTFILMTVWASLAVEFVHPVIQDVKRTGVWDDCPRCERAFATVLSADITFFQTIIAGDSWGKVSIPCIEKQPLVIVIFVGSLLTLIFGVLNLVIAVVVDTTADMRSKAYMDRGQEMDQDEKEDKHRLGRMFLKIDADGGGTVSYDELEEAAKILPEFRNRLRVMDIDLGDLRNLFSLLDEDGSGEIDQDEFSTALHRMQTADTKTTVKLIKYMMQGIQEKQAEAQVGMENQLKELYTRVQEISQHELDTVKMIQTADTNLQEHKEDVKSSLESHGAIVTETVKNSVSIALAQAFEGAQQIQAGAVFDRVDLAVQAAVDRALEEATELAWPAPDPILLDLKEDKDITPRGASKTLTRVGPRGPRGRSRTPTMAPAAEILVLGDVAAFSSSQFSSGLRQPSHQFASTRSGSSGTVGTQGTSFERAQPHARDSSASSAPQVTRMPQDSGERATSSSPRVEGHEPTSKSPRKNKRQVTSGFSSRLLTSEPLSPPSRSGSRQKTGAFSETPSDRIARITGRLNTMSSGGKPE